MVRPEDMRSIGTWCAVIALSALWLATSSLAGERIVATDDLPSDKPSSAAEPIVGTISPIPEATWKVMQGRSWRSSLGCPSRVQLAFLRIPYLDFEGRSQLGEMIVARSVASDVLGAFNEIFRSGAFRIASIQLIDKFDGDDSKSMIANNTSAFNCRTVAGTRRLSEHAFGKAIDINPIQNPYVSRGTTEPPAGVAYDSAGKRARPRIGMIREGDVVTKAFAKIGWKWGGKWHHSNDYQHFSLSGR